MFQYPLFRIVDCFALHPLHKRRPSRCFNIRSFGSWIASYRQHKRGPVSWSFQYPLFRIVDCFHCQLITTLSGLTCFNIRSFGSWIASCRNG